MDEKKKKSRVVFIAGGIALVVVLLAVTTYGLKATSTVGFCTSCHEMKAHAEELQYSTHAKDKDGNETRCSDCHIPSGYGPRYLSVKIYSGVKDLYVHFREAPESINRAGEQLVARRFLDDANCLRCHEDLYKDAKGEADVSREGRLAHDAYLGKNGQARSNCAGCHINIAHLPDFDRRLDVNTEFAERIQKQEEYR
ncbi:NapC/NirT family cytochrome c [Desulfosarcina sp. OttesenSCG-928-A07]|nr:NapC/NirT family cytochrome c [Desulfosarcina sp. OttesenSCG-928-G17]MDL2328462.1 NapC/NirT family cytochrome c [Desulfosarcina sp. OttesenSCG-928-A07]